MRYTVRLTERGTRVATRATVHSTHSSVAATQRTASEWPWSVLLSAGTDSSVAASQVSLALGQGGVRLTGAEPRTRVQDGSPTKVVASLKCGAGAPVDHPCPDRHAVEICRWPRPLAIPVGRKRCLRAPEPGGPPAFPGNSEWSDKPSLDVWTDGSRGNRGTRRNRSDAAGGAGRPDQPPFEVGWATSVSSLPHPDADAAVRFVLATQAELPAACAPCPSARPSRA